MLTESRRYDIDWLRVIAIGLLLLYHVAIGFQKWGLLIGFITNSTSIDSIWPLMTMLNVWRIPLLFFVSGMGVYFALQNRNWKQLLKERSIRIFIPYVFGMLTIVPIQMYLMQRYYNFETNYSPNPAHLWFLGNIFIYVIILVPIFNYLKNNSEGKVATWIRTVISNPIGLLLVTGVFIAEALLLQPDIYEMYAMTWHGFFLGLIAFMFGFCFVLTGHPFWKMIYKWKWLFLVSAISLYVNRLFQNQIQGYTMLMVVESNLWIYSILAFGFKYLNYSNRALRYLNQAAYPVYVVHMIFLFLASLVIFPLALNPYLKFTLVLLATCLGSLASYEFVIKRVKVLRPLFGLKTNL